MCSTDNYISPIFSLYISYSEHVTSRVPIKYKEIDSCMIMIRKFNRGWSNQGKVVGRKPWEIIIYNLTYLCLYLYQCYLQERKFCKINYCKVKFWAPSKNKAFYPLKSEYWVNQKFCKINSNAVTLKCLFWRKYLWKKFSNNYLMLVRRSRILDCIWQG